MASLDYRLNPLYAIKECSSCGALYTTDYCCSKGGLVDKIICKTPDSSQRPPQNCARCGNPVDGPYCRGCALLRKKFKEDLFTYCVENGIFQDFQDTSESSDDNTNVVNAPQEPFVVKQDPGKNSSQSPPHIDHHCCYECGDSLDDIFCQRCTCKSCGKGAHIGYNCPPKVPIISNPEPCNNQTVDELSQTLPSFNPTCYSEDGSSFTYDSTPNFVNDSPNVFNPPPQPSTYSYEICGNDAYYGHDCSPQVPFTYNPEPCYNQDFNFPQNFQSFQQQYLCCNRCGGPHETFQCNQLIFDEPYCENCGGPHETYQCQPMNEDYYHEQNSCYDPNSFGFDQFQPLQYTVNHPIFNTQNKLLSAQNDLFNSQNKLIEQMTSLRDMVSQYMQKKEEEKQIEDEQAAKARYWKILVCYDDDEDEESSIPLKDIIISGLPPCVAITPALSTEEPVDSLIMEDEHLDTIPATESDEFIKSSVENLVQNPSESEDFSDIESECDVPVCDNFTTFSNPLFDADDDVSSSDDESFSDEDVPNEIYSNPLFDEEIISVKIDASIISKIDSLVEQFSGELAHIDLIPPGVNETDFDLEEDIRFIERLLYDNSSPRPPEAFQDNSDTIIESPPTFPILVEDSDSLREEIDIFPGLNDSIPPGIESDDFDSEDDDNSTFLLEFESFYVDYPESRDSTIVVVEDIPVDVPNILPTHPALLMDFEVIPSYNALGSNISSPSEDRNKIYDPRICIEVESTRFLATLSPVIDTLLPFSSENEDKVFNHGVLASKEKSPPSSSHRGFKASKLFHHESPMLIHEDNTPNLGVRHPHFYPP
ncbi:hypothetical protein Tco_0324572 [Tanacetum coccineum]